MSSWIWPEVSDAGRRKAALRRGVCIAAVFALLSAVGGLGLLHGTAGVLSILVFVQLFGFVWLAIGLYAGSRVAAVSLLTVFLVNIAVANLLYPVRPAILGVELLLLLLLVGTLRAAWWRASKPAVAVAGPAGAWANNKRFSDAVAAACALCMLVLPSLLIVSRPFQTPTVAMEPTLRIGDRFFILLPRYMGAVRRGDLVVVAAPGPLKLTTVKRVVGLPGDRLRLEGGRLYLNNAPLAEPYLADKEQFRVNDFPQPEKPLLLNGQYAPLVKAMYRDDVRGKELVVPAGAYFVLGDNRGNSLDSRYFGPVPEQSITGRPVFVYAVAKDSASKPHWIARTSLP